MEFLPANRVKSDKSAILRVLAVLRKRGGRIVVLLDGIGPGTPTGREIPDILARYPERISRESDILAALSEGENKSGIGLSRRFVRR